MQSIFSKLWNNEYSRGGIVLTVSSFLANFFNYLFNSIAGRALGPEGFGELSAFFSYTFITSIPLLVLTTIVIQKISASGEKRFTYTVSLERFYFGMLKKRWFLLIPVMLFIPFIPTITNLGPITSYALVPFLVISFITGFYNAALQGLKLFILYAFVSLMLASTKLMGAVLVYFRFGGLLTIIAALIVATIFNLIIGHLMINKSIRSHAPKSTEIQKKLRHIFLTEQFIVTTISMLAITLLNNGDIIFVKKFFSPFDAGIYAGWSLFAKIILYVITPFISVSFVYFSASKKGQSKTMLIALTCIVFLGLCAFIGYSIRAQLWINILFGERFITIAPHMGRAAIFGTFYTAIYYLNNYFVAKKSRASLILALALPIYIAVLFMLRNAYISSIMTLNILFAGAIAAAYILAFLKNPRSNIALSKRTVS